MADPNDEATEYLTWGLNVLEELGAARVIAYAGDSTGLEAWARVMQSDVAGKLLPLLPDSLDMDVAAVIVAEALALVNAVAFAAFHQMPPPRSRRRRRRAR